MENFKIYTVENPTNENLDCVLFGQLYNLFKGNFGSDKELILLPCDSSESYMELLNDSANGLTVNVMNMQSISDCIPESLHVSQHHPDRNELSLGNVPIEKEILDDGICFSGKINTYIPVNQGTSLKFEVLAKSKIIFTIGFTKDKKYIYE